MSKTGCQLVLVAALLMLPVNTIHAEENVRDETYQDGYEMHLNTMIEKCDCKKAYRNSGSNELRKLAAISTMKSAYLREYKLELIDEMDKHEIGNKSYQVQYFLNNKFFEIAKNP
ncbi:hypothetical protein DSCW_64620 [Desulfosarcina widdelii]|uniref:Uncharacterized protein n=1 Tax=Desulfosarcina widdelii TaxID=947919 RepID=A0A5K7ZE30_9BACT|nr:hypothetical protein [Desulfosarcina widdelii]BBO79045.1 hypothetical protein DSCW_64620 [Desulfosarcina widdelii]